MTQNEKNFKDMATKANESQYGATMTMGDDDFNSFINDITCNICGKRYIVYKKKVYVIYTRPSGDWYQDSLHLEYDSLTEFKGFIDMTIKEANEASIKLQNYHVY